MKKKTLWFAASLACLAGCTAPDTSIRPVPFTDVKLTEGFWKERMQTELKTPRRSVVADARVKEDEGCRAVTQGPLVLCEETVEGVTETLPYYAWANKGNNSRMRVWIPRETANEE